MPELVEAKISDPGPAADLLDGIEYRVRIPPRKTKDKVSAPRLTVDNGPGCLA
jgi:hypothetical protein